MRKYIELNEIDLAVAAVLKTNYSVQYLGTKRVFDDKHVNDCWLVKFGSFEFNYYTGAGHRLGLLGTNYKLTSKQTDNVKKLKELLKVDRLDQTVFKIGGDWGKEYAVSPTQASVLYCLLLDASGAEQNFNDWCYEFGYDNDSMKDFKTYQACCDTLEKIRKLFTSKEREELAELLQDY